MYHVTDTYVSNFLVVLTECSFVECVHVCVRSRSEGWRAYKHIDIISESSADAYIRIIISTKGPDVRFGGFRGIFSVVARPYAIEKDKRVLMA